MISPPHKTIPSRPLDRLRRLLYPSAGPQQHWGRLNAYEQETKIRYHARYC